MQDKDKRLGISASCSTRCTMSRQKKLEYKIGEKIDRHGSSPQKPAKVYTMQVNKRMKGRDEILEGRQMTPPNTPSWSCACSDCGHDTSCGRSRVKGCTMCVIQKTVCTSRGQTDPKARWRSVPRPTMSEARKKRIAPIRLYTCLEPSGCQKRRKKKEGMDRNGLRKGLNIIRVYDSPEFR